MRLEAKLYIGLVLLGGAWSFIHAMSSWHSDDIIRCMSYMAVSILVSGLKVNLPGFKGTMSVNFLFILIGVSQLTVSETMLLGCLGTLAQCLYKSKQEIKPIRVLFSVASMAIAITGCYAFSGIVRTPNTATLLLAASLVFFFLNTAPIAAVIALTEDKPLAQTWRDCYFWSFPFYVAGASIAWVLSLVSRGFGWHGSLLLLPILLFIHRSYREYMGRLEDEKKHVEEVASLHLRTIEALALAIEAKDQTTHDHLRRVRTYVEEIGKEMKLSELELDALRAAALLHDIGKLAVPEHIISKPGKMTAEEFEKMKIHPIVGAEILECVGFPSPVVPIVKAHHEKWDGTGYPYGLKGEEIPIGARILAAVDCLDALASDRQYRRAIPLDDAMAHVEAESGKSFDPQVVIVLQRRYRDLEGMADSQPLVRSRLSRDVPVGRGVAPAAGLEVLENGAKNLGQDFLSTIAEARQEVHLLFELTREVGNSLSLDETLSVVAARLRRMIPYDTIVVYILSEGRLKPQYVNGEDFRLFSSLDIPIGQGLSGWVAENHKPIINGNPSVEPGYLNDPGKFSILRSALAVPLDGINGTVGVLTLYRSAKDAFSKDNLRILLAISAKVSLSIENALKFQQAEDSATTDYLTNLPNARSLFLRLDAELARSKREDSMLTVLVCDLNGFKQINDRHGHLEGNRVLRDVADALRSNCREYDYVARMGGDEFVLLLPGNDDSEISARTEQLRQIAWEAGSIDNVVGQVSMSIGAAVYPRDGSDADQLLAEADRRMYKAKQAAKLEAAGAHRSHLAEQCWSGRHSMIKLVQPGATARRFPLGRRIAGALVRIAATVLIGGLVSATLVRFSPGFGMDEDQLNPQWSSATRAAIREAHDEERNPARFYLGYIKRICAGDFGFSRSLNRPIGELLAERAPATAGLMAGGISGAWVLALLLSIPPVTWRLPRLAALCTLFSGVTAGIPIAGVALLLYRFGGPATWIMAVILFPRLYQYLGNLLRQAYDMPHVLLARAKGVGSHRILMQHVLRPTRAQILALAAVSINMAFGAAVAVEAICDLPGLGQLAWKSALARDLPVLVGLTMIITLMTQISSLVADAFSPAPRSGR